MLLLCGDFGSYNPEIFNLVLNPVYKRFSKPTSLIFSDPYVIEKFVRKSLHGHSCIYKSILTIIKIIYNIKDIKYFLTLPTKIS